MRASSTPGIRRLHVGIGLALLVDSINEVEQTVMVEIQSHCKLPLLDARDADKLWDRREKLHMRRGVASK